MGESSDSEQPGGLIRIHASNFEELHLIGERLHDEYFDVKDVLFDEGSESLEIPFRRIWHDGPRRVIKNRLIYRVEEVDVLRCSLYFRNVTGYECKDRAHIGTYSFSRFQYDKVRKMLIIHANLDCVIEISMNEIDAEYREIEYRGNARITIGLFWDLNSSKVYEE